MKRKPLRLTALLLAACMLLCCCGKKEKSRDSSSGSKADGTTAPQTTAAPEPVTTLPPLERKAHEVDPEKPVIALTFDDGPNTVTTPQVLDLLEKYDAVGSFFLIGSNINEDNEEVVKRAYTMGCDIENHSFTHSNFTTMDIGSFTEEVTKTDDLIYDIVREKPKFFRAPYTYANTDMYENIDKCFISGFGCNDWDDSVSVNDRVKGVMDQAADGAVILLHDAQGNQKTVDALEKIIPRLQKQGYQLVTISELFEAKELDPSAERFKYRQISNVLQ